MSTPEGRIRNAIMSWLKYHRIKCWIYDSVGIYDQVRKCYRVRHGVHRTVGLPDVHGILPGGRFLAVEVKVPGRYPSKDQKAQIQAICEAGGVAFVARSLKDMEDQLLPLLPKEGQC